MKEHQKILFVLCLLFSPLATADWQSLVNDLNDLVKGETSSEAKTGLSEETIVKGLKQALKQGVDKSVKQLGQPGGFLKDKQVRIPMPRTLKEIDTGLRKLGQGKTADKFVQTMNKAAEKAVPGTVDILTKAVKSMTLEDAGKILKGKPDAATRYFQRKSSQQLRSAIKPVVQKATNSVGLTRSYKEMINKAGFLAQFFDKDSLDIDQYVTEKAINGLFIKMADEEKRIREKPVARTTEILKTVFK